MMRTLQVSVLSEPSGLTSPSCRKRSRLTWKDGRHLGDLVEKHGAAVGGAKQAEPVRDGAGEGAALVAEQLRLQQLVGHAAAILHHQRAGAAARVVMDAARQQLLAGAGLALDQDRQLGLRRLAREVAKLGHLLADIDELLEALALRARAACPWRPLNSSESPENLNSRDSRRWRRASSRVSSARLTTSPTWSASSGLRTN